jgi:ABC-type amino acid transport system permease subunit
MFPTQTPLPSGPIWDAARHSVEVWESTPSAVFFQIIVVIVLIAILLVSVWVLYRNVQRLNKERGKAKNS